MADSHSHYKPLDSVGKVEYRWVMFDNVMPEDVLRELMSPVEPEDFIRKEERSIVCFHADWEDQHRILTAVRKWEREVGTAIHEEIRQRRAAESDAAFQRHWNWLQFRRWPGMPPQLFRCFTKS